MEGRREVCAGVWGKRQSIWWLASQLPDCQGYMRLELKLGTGVSHLGGTAPGPGVTTCFLGCLLVGGFIRSRGIRTASRHSHSEGRHLKQHRKD